MAMLIGQPFGPGDAAMLRCGEDHIGTVVLALVAGYYSGRFFIGPDFQRYRDSFIEAIKAARDVDEAPPDRFCEVYSRWEDAVRKINRLSYTAGDDDVPVENLSIDADWNLEFEIPLWWVEEETRAARPLGE